MDISKILSKFYSEHDWHIGHDYNSLVFRTGVKPTLQELQEKDLLLKKQDLHMKIKSIAMEKILAIAPDWKQRNLLAYSCDVLNKMILNDPITPEEQAAIDLAQAHWNRVKALRAYSDQLEVLVDNTVDVDSLDINSGWPE